MIKIICVGKIKEKFYREAIEEYTKRLSKYTKLQIIEVEDEANCEKALKIESERILKHIKEKDYIITLEITGKEYDSQQLANFINESLTKSHNLTFIIGGSYGLDQKIKEKAKLKLSFSKMTFPHQLFRIILLEQIYRSYKIINNEKYHK